MPKVSMIEVPDEEDNTSFWKYEEANKSPPVVPEVTQPMVARSSDPGVKTEKVPHEWLRPFGAEWTLCRVVEAKTKSEAKVILKNWIHKAWVDEVVNEMIEGFRQSEQTRALWWLEELQQPKWYICWQSGGEKDLTMKIQIETLENHTQITTTALVNSRCTSSTISWIFVEQNHIPTHTTAALITVYNTVMSLDFHGNSNTQNSGRA